MRNNSQGYPQASTCMHPRVDSHLHRQVPAHNCVHTQTLTVSFFKRLKDVDEQDGVSQSWCGYGKGVAYHEFAVPTDRCEEPFPCSSSLCAILMSEGYFRSLASFVLPHVPQHSLEHLRAVIEEQRGSPMTGKKGKTIYECSDLARPNQQDFFPDCSGNNGNQPGFPVSLNTSDSGHDFKFLSKVL